MLVLSENARKRYAELTSMAAKDVASGNDRILDLLNLIHDKYKVAQTYPNLGTPVPEKDGVRKILLRDGWAMLYTSEPNRIMVVDFVKEQTD